MIRLIALDIDGTLLDRTSHVPEANRRAIVDATARGIEVALVTGRRFDFTRAILAELDGPLTLILNNGAVVKTRDGQTLERSLLPARIARQVLDATREFRRHAAVVFDRPREAQIVHEPAALAEPALGRYFERNREFVAERPRLEETLDEDPIQIMFVGSIERMRALERHLRSLPGAAGFAVAVTEYVERDLSLVDVIREGCSKGAALAAWAARRGVAPHEVMAIGDNLNDREMLEFAGVPVVMGNAVAALKSLGWPVTGTNDEAGVAAAIERFALASIPGASP